jgi:hypothetical protein
MGLDLFWRLLSQERRTAMTAAPFDTLKLSRQLRARAHFDQEQAEGLAETLAEAFHEQIATKTDMQNMQNELKLLGNKMKRLIPIVLSAPIGAAVPQSAEARDLEACQAAISLHGLVTRGSFVCNRTWLDRDGRHMILALARECNKTPKIKKLLRAAFVLFDQKARTEGMVAACNEIDRTIGEFEHEDHQ